MVSMKSFQVLVFSIFCEAALGEHARLAATGSDPLQTEPDYGVSTAGVTGHKPSLVEKDDAAEAPTGATEGASGESEGKAGKHDHRDEKSKKEHEEALAEGREEVELEGEHGELEEEAIAQYIIIPIAGALIVSLFAGALVERFELHWLPESAVTLVIGVCLGFYMQKKLAHNAFFEDDEVFNSMCYLILNLFLLPIIIFEAGWSLRYKDFASQFEYIMLFAVVGSLMSFVTVGSLIYYTGENGLGLHSIAYARTAFAYASLIAATDPVATLATYSKLKVDPLLNIIVFGDSTFNDAVAIVLFKVLNNDSIMGLPGSRPSYPQLTRHILGGVTQIFLGSVVVGLAVGAAFLLAVRVLHMRDTPRLEILALVLVAYICFCVAEVVGMSGIIATSFCAMLLGIYARPHLSKGGSVLSSFFIKQLACYMDTSIFLLTGFCAVSIGKQGIWFGMCASVFCLIGRAVGVFPVSIVVNSIKRQLGKYEGLPEENWNLLSNKATFMIWHAGLRGGISLTLAMQLGPWVDRLDGAGTRHLLQTATYFIIIVFLMGFGGSTEWFLHKLHIPIGKESDPDELYDKEAPGSLQKGLRWLDDKVLQPTFVGDKKLAGKITKSVSSVDLESLLSKAMRPVRKGGLMEDRQPQTSDEHAS